MSLTHQEAERIVRRAEALLDGFRQVPRLAPGAAEAGFERALDRTVSSFLESGSREVLLKGLSRSGEKGSGSRCGTAFGSIRSLARARPGLRASLRKLDVPYGPRSWLLRPRRLHRRLNVLLCSPTKLHPAWEQAGGSCPPRSGAASLRARRALLISSRALTEEGLSSFAMLS